jgi:hypothetical protein
MQESNKSMICSSQGGSKDAAAFHVNPAWRLDKLVRNIGRQSSVAHRKEQGSSTSSWVCNKNALVHLRAAYRFILSRSFQVILEPDSGSETAAEDLIPSPARFWLDLTSSGSTNPTRSSRESNTPKAFPGVQPCFIRRRWPILEVGNGVGG